MAKKIFGNRFMSVVWTVLFTVLIGWGIDYLALVPMNFSSRGFWWFTLCMLIIGIVLSFIFTKIYLYISDEDYYGDFEEYIKDYCIPWILVACLIIFIIVMFVTSIGGWKMGNSDQYADLITIEEGNFEEEIPNASEDKDVIIYIDQKTAQKLGDRALGSMENASWYEADPEYNLVLINGKYFRITPINYGGFWASRRVRSNGGIPGYICVDAQTEDGDATIVYFEEGEEMIYSPSGNFSYDLNRHIHEAYPTKMLGKSFYEVDDNNHPYWITEIKEATIGMRGGVIVKSFIITDAASGEMKEYTVDTLPEWIDHAFSLDSLMEIVGWHYRYQNGFFNMSKTNLYKTTYSYRSNVSAGEENAYTPFDGYNTGISKDGKIIFYTGITPDNRAETNIGFISANPRTGEIRFYSVTGAEESSAQIAAEGLISNMKYSASFPVLINVDGVETYFMVLKDAGGLVQRYALCNIKNYAKCVEAASIDEAIIKYKKEIGLIAADDSYEDTDTEKNETNVDTNEETFELTGIVKDVKEAQIKGYTYYYFTVEGSDIVFMSSIENSNMQPMKLLSGTTVTIKYHKSEESGIGIVKSISF